MTAHLTGPRLPFLTLAAQIAALLVMLMGGLVLAGWLLDAAMLRSFIPGVTPMNPTTAATFVLAGLSMGLLQRPRSGPSLRWIGRAGAVLVALTGGVKLGEYLFGWNLGLDQLLFGRQLGSVDASLPVRVRMAPNTALNFLLLGAALLLSDRQTSGGRWTAQCVTLTALFTSFFALIGYAYDVKPFYSVIAYIPMAFHTALTFIVLGVGLLLWQPALGVTAIVSSDHPGGMLARRLLPVVLLFPIILGWLRLQGQRSGLFGEEFGVALFAVAMVMVTMFLLLWNGWSLNRADIERRRAEETLLASEERFRQIAEHAQDIFWIATIDFHRVLYVSPSYETVWGRSRESLYARPLDWIEAIHPEEREAVGAQFERALQREGDFDVEYRIVRPDGAIRHIHDRGFFIRDAQGRIYRIAGIATDVTEQKSLEEHLQKLAHYDPLTGLPNRVLFYDRLHQALARAKRQAQRVAVLYYDLDQFKRINDTYGHEVGDLLLMAVSKRLTASVREADTLSRLGGDEFAVILPDIAEVADVSVIARKILDALTAPFHVKGQELFTTVSIGVSLYPEDGADPDELVKHADAAMYRAKQRGRNTYQFYSAGENVEDRR
jgi:diguanylate cyclase (GGDEF)-like protein/PAS domain S-box-containing protein